MKAAHDSAMFGAPLLPPSPEKDEEDIKSTKEETTESAMVSNLISDQVKKHAKFLLLSLLARILSITLRI